MNKDFIHKLTKKSLWSNSGFFGRKVWGTSSRQSHMRHYKLFNNWNCFWILFLTWCSCAGMAGCEQAAPGRNGPKTHRTTLSLHSSNDSACWCFFTPPPHISETREHFLCKILAQRIPWNEILIFPINDYLVSKQLIKIIKQILNK